MEKFFPWHSRTAVRGWKTLPLENNLFALPLVKVWSKVAEFWFFEDWVPVGQIRLEKFFHICAGAAVRIAESYHLILSCLTVSL